MGFNHPLRYADPPGVTYTRFVPVETSEGTQWVDRADPMVGPFTSPADKLFADKICGQLERGETSVGAVIVGFTSCVRQVQQIDHVERVLVGFQVNSSIPLFDRK